MIDLKILAPPLIKYFGDLHPFHKWEKGLHEAGIKIEIFYDHTHKKLLGAENLMVHHRYFDTGWVNALSTATDPDSDFVKFLIHLKSSVGKLIWFDAGDSSGTTQFPVIPYVDVFVKKQILKDINYYGGESHERKNLMVWSNQSLEQKQFIPCPYDQLHKIKVGWNIAFNDYRNFVVHYKVRKYLSYLVNYNTFPVKYTAPSDNREFDVTFRGKINYANKNKVVSDQRNKVLEIFKTLPLKISSGGSFGRNKYLNELTKSKVTISPFGLGEVCFRDYETFISGSLLVKPSMSHLDMYPDLFKPNETYIPINWDMEDLNETLYNIITNYNTFKQIAMNGQELYKKNIDDPEPFIKAVMRVLG